MVCRVVILMVPVECSPAIWCAAIHCSGVSKPPGTRSRIIKEYSRSSFFSARSSRRSRSSCWYMPWNFTSDWSSSLTAPVSPSCNPWANVPRRPSLFCLIRSTADKFFMSLILVYVFYKPSRIPQLVEIQFRLRGAFCSFLPDDTQQGRFHIHAHRLPGTADIHMGAAFEPVIEFRRMLR